MPTSEQQQLQDMLDLLKRPNDPVPQDELNRQQQQFNYQLQQFNQMNRPFARPSQPQGMPDSGPFMWDRLHQMGRAYGNLAPPLKAEDPFVSFPYNLPSGDAAPAPGVRAFNPLTGKAFDSNRRLPRLDPYQPSFEHNI